MAHIPDDNTGLYASLLKKITSYHDRLSVRYVLEKLLVAESQSVIVNERAVREYLSTFNIQLLLTNNFIVKHEMAKEVYYELSNNKLIGEMEEYADNAPNKDLFDNDALTQSALKALRRRQEILERGRRLQLDFARIRLEWEAKVKIFFYEVVAPVVVVTLTAIIIFAVTHFI